jgi:hypothetical protein
MNLESQKVNAADIINSLLSKTPPDPLNVNIQKNRLTLSNTHIPIWSKVAKEITKSFDDVGINYVLIKAYNVPYVHMDDVDFLIEEENEICEAIDILRDKFYSFYRDRYSLNSLKITAIPCYRSVQVDIYPEPTWFNMRYAPDFFITKHRLKRRVLGIETYMPTPTLDMYIVATHSYNHGFISLAEAAHVVRLISENQLDWGLLKNLANTFKLNHALYPFLKMAQLSLLQDEIDNGICKLINEMEQKDALTRIYSKWLRNSSPNGFPLKIPLKLRWLSSSARLFRTSLKSYTKGYDELLGYALALFLRGKTRGALQ